MKEVNFKRLKRNTYKIDEERGRWLNLKIVGENGKALYVLKKLNKGGYTHIGENVLKKYGLDRIRHIYLFNEEGEPETIYLSKKASIEHRKSGQIVLRVSLKKTEKQMLLKRYILEVIKDDAVTITEYSIPHGHTMILNKNLIDELRIKNGDVLILNFYRKRKDGANFEENRYGIMFKEKIGKYYLSGFNEHIGKDVSLKVTDTHGNSAYLIREIKKDRQVYIEDIDEVADYGIDVENIASINIVELLENTKTIHFSAVAKKCYQQTFIRIPALLLSQGYAEKYKYITVMKKRRSRSERFSLETMRGKQKYLSSKTTRWMGFQSGDIITAILKNEIRKGWKIEVHSGGKSLILSNSVFDFGIDVWDFLRVTVYTKNKSFHVIGQATVLATSNKARITLPYKVPCIKNHIKVAKMKSHAITTYLEPAVYVGKTAYALYIPQMMANFFGVKRGDSLKCEFEDGKQAKLVLKVHSRSNLERRYIASSEIGIPIEDICGKNMAKIKISSTSKPL